MYMYICYLKERKKDRHLRQWKNEKMRVASGGIRSMSIDIPASLYCEIY